MTRFTHRWLTFAVIFVTLIGAALAFVLLRPLTLLDANTRFHLWRKGVRSEYVSVGDLRLHYLEATPAQAGEGRPLLLIHGLGARSLDWAPLIPGLVHAGFHVYIPDLPGYGLSSHPDADYSIRYQEAAILGFTQALHLDQPDVAGWSMGGWIALRLAADHPRIVHRLVLLDSAGLYFTRDYTDQLFTPTDLAGVQLLWHHLTPKTQQLPDFLARDIVRRSRRNAWVVHRGLASMLSGRDLMQFRLGEVRTPTLVVWGMADRLIPPAVGRQLAHGIPDATFVGIPDCGHLLPAECADAALPPITQFLRSSPDSPSAAR